MKGGHRRHAAKEKKQKMKEKSRREKQMKTGFKTKLIALLLAFAMLAELSPVSAVDLTEDPAPQ